MQAVDNLTPTQRLAAYRQREALAESRIFQSFEPEMGHRSDMMRQVCDWRFVDMHLIASTDRTVRVRWARHEICYWLREKKGMSYPAIGKIINRHHTAVLNSCAVYAARHGLPMKLYGMDSYGSRRKSVEMVVSPQKAWRKLGTVNGSRFVA